jgi:hypothetical protein
MRILFSKAGRGNVMFRKIIHRTKTLHTQLQLAYIHGAGTKGITEEELIAKVTGALTRVGSKKDVGRWERESGRGYTPHVSWVSKRYAEFIETVGDPEEEKKKKKTEVNEANAADTPVASEDADIVILTDEECPL